MGPRVELDLDESTVIRTLSWVPRLEGVQSGHSDWSLRVARLEGVHLIRTSLTGP